MTNHAVKRPGHPLQMTFTWPAEDSSGQEPGDCSGQCQWTVTFSSGWGTLADPRQCSRSGRRDLCGVSLCSQHERIAEEHLDSYLRDHPEELRRLYWECVFEPQLGELPDPGRSVVYFIEREGLVKIGTSTNLAQRLRDIGKGGQMVPGMTVGPVRLLATMPGDHRHEGYLHRRFRPLRVGGEWFVPDEDLCEFIRTRHNVNLDLLYEVAIRHGIEEEEEAS